MGAGTGQTEHYLQHRGFKVVASDIDVTSLDLCKNMGLDVIRLDVTDFDLRLVDCEAIYIDGVLGHLYKNIRWSDLAENLAKTGCGHLLLSNDLSDTDLEPNFTVHGKPGASFFRPPTGFFADIFCDAGQWRPAWTHILNYRRPGRGIRRRELLVLENLTDARKDER
ncbi:MAG: hypothetical protein WBB23_08750 [Desulforhopalus sp.]